MPKVQIDGKTKHFPYTEKGKKAAKRAKRRKWMGSSDGKVKV